MGYFYCPGDTTVANEQFSDPSSTSGIIYKDQLSKMTLIDL